MSPSSPLKLRVFTLNCWGIGYMPFLQSPDRVDRVAALAQHLKQDHYDFVLLQELWVESDRKHIIEQCKECLPYAEEFQGGIIGSGTMILSRYPFQDMAFHRFSLNGFVHQVLYGDGACAKGIGMVRVELPNGMTANVYVSHLHAEYNRESDPFIPDRSSQALEAVEFIRHTSSHSDVDFVIYGGDFNTEHDDLPHRVFTKYGRLDDNYDEHGRIPTYDLKRNVYVKEGGREITLDYIMHRPVKGRGVRTRAGRMWNPLPDKIPGRDICYSDHEPVAIDLEVTPVSADADEDADADAEVVQIKKNTLDEVLEVLTVETAKSFWEQTVLVAGLFLLLAIFFWYISGWGPNWLSFLAGSGWSFLFCITIISYQERRNALKQVTRQVGYKRRHLK